MTQVSATLVDGMQFAVKTDSGHTIIIDSIPAVGGNNAGPRPLELMAASVAGCTAMDVISILRKMKQKVTDFTVQVSSERATDHPKKFLCLHIQYVVTGHRVAEDKVARAIELSETVYCPALASLHPDVSISSGCTILEADESE